jgi:glycosyltransferase involved in cell wall biosynthesis
MRMAILVDELPTSAAPRIVCEEAYHLKEFGVNTHVYVLKNRINEIEPVHISHIKMTHLDKQLGVFEKLCGFKIPTFSFFSLYHVIYPYTLAEMANQVFNHYDAILIHYSSTALFATKLALRKTKRLFYCWDPISYIFSSAYLNKWSSFRRKTLSRIALALDRKLFSKVDLVILPSKFHYKRVRILTNKPIKILYPGTNVAHKIPEKRGNYILAVARWEIGKNPFFLIDVARALKDDEFKIVMVGPWRPPELLHEFKRKAKEKEVFKKFKFLGSKYGDELENLYLHARCLIHPKTEAFGFTGLEAAAHGCPIIFPKGSGVTDLFTHGVHGLFPSEGDVDGYVKYVRSFLTDERLPWEMGSKAWEVAKQYTWKNHAKNLLKIMRSG